MTRPALLFALLLVGWSHAALAAELRHRVGESETLEAIAKNYYGASWKAVYLEVRNELAPGINPAGRELLIPASWNYSVRKGDSLASIAKRHLGDPNRHKALMIFNNIKDAADLAVGQNLLMPFHLSHTLKPAETLAQVSQRYYRNTRRSSFLKEYNSAESLKPGQRITVPIFDSASVDVKARRYTAPAASPSGVAASTTSPPIVPPVATLSPAEARQRLQRALALYGAGEFDQACTALEELLELNPFLGADAAELIKHLGFCAVALDDPAAARDYFRKWLELEPKATLDPVLVSPKIRKIFFDVSGERSPSDGQNPPPSP